MQQASGTQSTKGRIPRSAADAATFVVATAPVVVLISLAVRLVNHEDASRAADDARVAILAEGTLSAAASTENASSQTVLAVTLASSDALADDDIVAAAVGALDRTSTS